LAINSLIDAYQSSWLASQPLRQNIMSEKAAPSHHHHHHDVDEETATLPYKAEEEEASAVTAGLTLADTRSDEEKTPSSSSSSVGTTSPATGWPHTFERSIALLASPILPAADAAFYSKSPAPGGLNLLLRRGGDLDRGIHTPIQLYGSTTNGRTAERTMMGAAAVDRHSERDLLLNGTRPALMARTPSLNLHQQIQSAALLSLLDVEQEHEKRQMEAKSYRQKLLQKKNNIINKSKKDQPKKNRVVENGQHQQGGEQHHEKASVLQCIFNLSNILMGVGLLGLPYVFRLTGYAGGVICILVLATICWRTAILIGRCLGNSHHCDDTKILTSFPDIARAAFGETGCYVLSTILYFEVRT
jgi:hypothetical protein